MCQAVRGLAPMSNEITIVMPFMNQTPAWMRSRGHEAVRQRDATTPHHEAPEHDGAQMRPISRLRARWRTTLGIPAATFPGARRMHLMERSANRQAWLALFVTGCEAVPRNVPQSVRGHSGLGILKLQPAVSNRCQGPTLSSNLAANRGSLSRLGCLGELLAKYVHYAFRCFSIAERILRSRHALVRFLVVQ